jgi:hypothetical protein
MGYHRAIRPFWVFASWMNEALPPCHSSDSLREYVTPEQNKSLRVHSISINEYKCSKVHLLMKNKLCARTSPEAI